MSEAQSQPAIERLVDVMRTLRSDNGCPWDREQDMHSLKAYLLEESYELIDAIDGGDSEAVRDELGDVLLQVVFQSRIAEENGWFDFNDVAEQIVRKLIRRHPHVFGDVEVEHAGEVLKNWEHIKRGEKSSAHRTSAVDGVPRSMPALQKAHHIQKKAARVGFDWDTIEPVVEKIDEELAEVRQALADGRRDRIGEELGDLLFAVVNLSRFTGHDAEQILHRTVKKFAGRFQRMEEAVHASGRQMTDCTLEELDAEWEKVKAGEPAPAGAPS